MDILTIDSIKNRLLYGDNPIKKSRVYGNNKINQYKLLENITIKLTNGDIITIPSGFIWDLASVPRIFWNIIPPDTDAEIAYLIHDFLYENRLTFNYKKEFVDLEMYKWSIATNSTKNSSIKNIDNKIRYFAVKYFGRKVWET